MKQSANILNSDRGAVVLTAAIMILAVITILGVVSQQISNTEVRIAGYEGVHLQNFYSAESSAMESVEILDTLNSPSAAGLPWIETTVDNLTLANILNKSFWTTGNGSVTP
jgi:Tfp pilus assembly protein PilX